MLAWTGERFIPGAGGTEIAYEHYVRYLFASRWVAGKRVLDIGSGEGYGSFLLSSSAIQVVGIDVDDEAVTHAQRRYRRPNLEYRVASATQLPQAERFDVVTCFEVIEHIDEETQHTLLNQVAELLTENGVFIVSTPNKPIYHEASGGEDFDNPFHLREMTFPEFCTLLESHFGEVLWNGQQTLIGNYIYVLPTKGTPAQQETVVSRGRFTDEGLLPDQPAFLEESKYFVAVCARERGVLEKLGRPLGDFALIDTASRRYHEYHAMSRWAQKLDVESKKQAQVIRQQEAQLRQLADLQRQFQALQRQRDAELKDHREYVNWLYARIETMEATRFWKWGAAYWRLHSQLRSLVHPAKQQSVPQGQAAPTPPATVQSDAKMIDSIHAIVRGALSPQESLIVLADGTEALLNLYDYQVSLLPLIAKPAGEPPIVSSNTGITRLELLRAQGAQRLLVPATAWTRLENLTQFKRHIEKRYRLIAGQAGTALLFALHEPVTVQPGSLLSQFDEILGEIENQLNREPEILDWESGLHLAAAFPERVIFSPPTGEPSLPYLEQTIDVVVTIASDPEIVEKARRLARVAVVTVPPAAGAIDPAAPAPPADFSMQVDWRLAEAQFTPPSVSIIIACFNGANKTENCLKAVTETLPKDIQAEIIVVDDASTDGTPELLHQWAARDRRLRILRNEPNLGFLLSCNRAAALATGKWLVLLNNDTIPMPGWLSALLRTFRDHPDAGAVGGKLVLADGSLQEAGGVVFPDGSAANFGRGERDLDVPLYNYVRPVDYCSGACLMTPRKLFVDLGGFDTRYAPAYYEDTDYCFQVREKGCRVYYQPECTIIHFEGSSSGTDLTAGVKKYQLVNQSKFYEKWKRVLRNQPARPVSFDDKTWYELASPVKPLGVAK